jgi:hypothetical protein
MTNYANGLWEQPGELAASDPRNHESFCRIEKWHRVRNARGKTGTHHITYELTLHDGRILRTRISHPADRSNYGQTMWRHILRDQLQVEERAFWICVQKGVKPDRGLPKSSPDALPVDLVHLLISRVGLSENEVAAMSKEEAILRLQQHWTDNG